MLKPIFGKGGVTIVVLVGCTPPAPQIGTPAPVYRRFYSLSASGSYLAG
ncbi:unnamed protein product [Amoebophrya sp. A120]|nr:unnamed protein product [Amoebophrya sp. A120]|eukprot:GSA120T00010236001.1